jgi:ComF family protein
MACGPVISSPLRALVHGLKYSGFRAAATELVEIASGAVPEGFLPAGAVLVPVPLHSARRRERGYNQSELAARSWTRSLAHPVGTDWLVRTRDTGTQTALDAGGRRANLAGAFRTGRSFRPGIPVVLVDDVLTTGATLSTCAAALLVAGCPEVRGLCLAWAGEA